jgi:mono/diheme cytochrome c family protein
MTRMVASAVFTAFVLLPGAAFSQDKAEKGMQVFTAQKCNVCHSIAGKGKKNGPLDDVGSRLSAAEIKQWILDPVVMAEKREPKSTRKPPMKKKPLPADEVDALVALLSGLKK